MPPSTILGIDQGTTGTRAVVMNSRGQVESSAYRKHQQIMPDLGNGIRGVEHDPMEIWNNTREVVEAVIANHDIAAIGIANQGETVMLWNRKTGEPLHNAIVWQDQRTQDWMDELRNDASLVKHVATTTGLRLDAYFSASKISWLLKNVPSAGKLLESGDLCAGTLDAWLIYKLTGGKSFVTDPSTVARTLLFDIHKQEYDEQLLSLFQIPSRILPEVVDRDFGTVSTIAGLEGVPIAASLVDQTGAVFGQGCLQPGDLKATYGTGCFVFMNTGPDPALNDSGLLSVIAWSRDAEVTYALDGGIFTAGAVVEYLSSQLGFLKDASELDSILEKTPTSGSVVCVPAFAGLAAPFWERGAKAAFFGMDLSTPSEVLVRAAMEGIACRVVQVVRAMEAAASTKVRSLRVDGGLVRSREFAQIQADLLGLPVSVLENPEATVMGVCYMAARMAGIWESDQAVLDCVRIARTVYPNCEAKSRDALNSRFDNACEIVKNFKS
ncbi:MAG: glycerol kinase [Puniceicoccaceae bacterium]